jgi:hypothetical protein
MASLMNGRFSARMVRGVVTRHEVYGFFVDIGEDVEGIALLTRMTDLPDAPTPEFPPIGTLVEAVLLGYGGSSQLRV